jgi:histidine phosphotransferase ChpT
MQIDLRVMELLASKLCHDLVSPVSAINNGVELIEDIGGSVVDEAMKLIGDSAQHASRRLRLFRMAYGRAGSDENLGTRDVRQIAEQYLANGKVTLSWPETEPQDVITSHKGALKVVLNMIVLSEEVLAYGGNVTLTAGPDGSCRFQITGRSAQLAEPIAAALDGETAIENLTPRSIQAYITGRFAAHFGLSLKYDQTAPEKLELILTVSPAHVAADTAPIVAAGVGGH